MKYSEILKAKRQAFLDTVAAILALCNGHKDDTGALVGREMTADEKKTSDDAFASAEALVPTIKTAESQEAALVARATPVQRVTQDNPYAISTDNRPQLLSDPTRGFKAGIGEFALLVKDPYRAGNDERMKIIAAAGDPTLQQGSASEGGYMVPPAFSTSIYEGLTKEADSLLQDCDQYTIPYGIESMTFPADAETSRADGSRAGGIQGYWKSELTQLTATRPTLREVKLAPQQLYVFAYLTDKLMQNAPTLTQYLNKKATDEIKFKINNAIFNGTGSGQPKGVMLGGSGLPRIDVTKETGQAGGSIVRGNIQKMWQRLMPRCQSRAKWYYDQSCLSDIANITLPVGTGGVPLMMPPGGLSGQSYATIYGRPMVPMEYCGKIGDAGDLILADLSAYAIGMRGGLDSAMSIHLKFDFAQTCFRFIFEIDGQPWLASALTPFTPAGGTTKTETLSPFCAIAARA